MSDMSPNELRAYVNSPGGWGQVGSISHQRYIKPVQPRSRRRCLCGCKQRATHLGMANGVALTIGCEWYVRRWVSDPRRAE